MNKWKWIKALTLILPLPIYLFLNAVLFSITPDVKINDEIADLSVVEYEDMYFIHGDEQTTYEGGYVVLNDGMIGAVIETDDVIQVGLRYYTYKETENGMELMPLKIIEETTSYQVSITVIISLIGVGIVILFVMGKMDILKAHPKTATLVGLWILALVFVAIETIVSNLTNVFIVAAITWTAYYIEDMAQNGVISKTEAEKKSSKIAEELKKHI